MKKIIYKIEIFLKLFLIVFSGEINLIMRLMIIGIDGKLIIFVIILKGIV